ncbi:MAG: GtrA family protein [Actinobacteria bacterium]|nr:GtrA family protein [Actinomycetota bacterium]
MIKLIYSLRHELGKFFSVGALAYVVGVGGFNILVHLESAPLASKPLTASIISGIVSIFFAYLGNRHWTWRDRARSGARREMSLFFIINGIALIFNVVCLAISRYVLGFESALADNIAANVIGVGLGTLFRFWSYRTIVFKRQ